MNTALFESEFFIGFIFGQTMDFCPKHGNTNHVFLGNPEDVDVKLKKVCKKCEQQMKLDLLENDGFF